MEEQVPQVPETTKAENSSLNVRLIAGFSCILLAVLCFIGFSYVKNKIVPQSPSQKSVIGTANEITPLVVSPTPQEVANMATVITPSTETTVAPSQDNSPSCSRTGYAQKWEFLTAYTVKDGDSLQSIATSQLNDASRANEIIQINGSGPFVVGTTIYLPPSSIQKSTGNIEEVYGKLVVKDNSYWHVSFSNDSSGLGVLIPSYWFSEIPNATSFKTGDCVKVLFDNGNKVYSAEIQ